MQLLQRGFVRSNNMGVEFYLVETAGSPDRRRP